MTDDRMEDRSRQIDDLSAQVSSAIFRAETSNESSDWVVVSSLEERLADCLGEQGDVKAAERQIAARGAVLAAAKAGDFDRVKTLFDKFVLSSGESVSHLSFPEKTVELEAMRDVQQLEENVGIGQLDFDREELNAVEWRATIWGLANLFSDGQCEMTHSEIQREEGEIKHVALCLTFFEKTHEQFAEFLKSSRNLVPAGIADIEIHIGFNYGSPGLITVNGEHVSYSQDKDLLEVPCNEKLSYRLSPAELEQIMELEGKIYESIMTTNAAESKETLGRSNGGVDLKISQLEDAAGMADIDIDRAEVIAVEWRGVMWDLANRFSEGRCEIEFSGIMSGADSGENLVLRLDFAESTINDFAEFLRESKHLIPTDLAPIDIYIGSSDSTQGLLKVSGKEVSFDSEKNLGELRDVRRFVFKHTSEAGESLLRLEDKIYEHVLGLVGGPDADIGKHHLFGVESSSSIAFADLPNSVQKIIEDEVEPDETVQVDSYPDQMVMEGRYLIPDHGWDYSERISVYDRVNLKEVGSLSAMGGPTVQILEKKDSAEPGYVVFKYLGSYEASYKLLKIE